MGRKKRKKFSNQSLVLSASDKQYLVIIPNALCKKTCIDAKPEPNKKIQCFNPYVWHLLQVNAHTNKMILCLRAKVGLQEIIDALYLSICKSEGHRSAAENNKQ